MHKLNFVHVKAMKEYGSVEVQTQLLSSWVLFRGKWWTEHHNVLGPGK